MNRNTERVDQCAPFDIKRNLATYTKKQKKKRVKKKSFKKERKKNMASIVMKITFSAVLGTST